MSPQKDRPRVSMAVPRHLKPVRPITLANDSPPSSPLRALGEHQARQAEMLKTPTAEEQQQQQADDNGNTEQGDGGAKLGQRQGQDGAAAAETEVSDDAVDAASPERSPNVSLGADMGLEEAVRVVTRGCLSIADVVRKSSGAAARRVSEIDANIANSRGAGPSGSAVVSVNVPAAEMKKRRSAVEANAQRMSAAAYILEKLHRTLDGEHLGANMVALREYADKAPRTPDVERNSAAVMTALLEEVSGPAGRRLRQQLAHAREQLQALMILAKSAARSASEAAGGDDAASLQCLAGGHQTKSTRDIFGLAARVAKRSDAVLAAVQTSVRHHLVK